MGRGWGQGLYFFTWEAWEAEGERKKRKGNAIHIPGIKYKGTTRGCVKIVGAWVKCKSVFTLFW